MQMKHLKLYENFDSHGLYNPTELTKELVDLGFGSHLENLIKEILNKVKNDPYFEGWKLSFETGSKMDYLLVIWDNPAISKKWRESGYADDYEKPEDAKPLPIVAIGTSENGEFYVRALSAEEKYHKILIDLEDEDDEYVDEDVIRELKTLDDFKKAVDFSLWEID